MGINTKQALWIILIASVVFPWTLSAQTYPHRIFEVLPHYKIYTHQTPDAKSPIADTLVNDRGFTKIHLLESSNPEWVRLEISVPVGVYDRRGKATGIDFRYEERYAGRNEFFAATKSAYLVNEGAVLNFRKSPSGSATVTDTLSGGGLFMVLGAPSGKWAKVSYPGMVKKVDRKGKIIHEEEYMEGYAVISDIENNSTPVIAESMLVVNHPGGGLGQALGKLHGNVLSKVGAKLDEIMDLEEAFPYIILGLTALYFIAAMVLRRSERASFVVRYFILTGMFALEIFYAAFAEYDLWFCDPEDVGWLAGILWTIVSLGVVYVQYNMFMGMLAQMMDRSRRFNTGAGVLLFTLITVVMFIYAVFSGGLSDKQNSWLIITLIGTQVLQMLISFVQLRKYPVYALMAVIFIPLGTFAVLLMALSVFKFAVLAALILLALGGMGLSKGSTALVSGDVRGPREWAKRCPYFRDSGERCEFQSCDCTIITKNKCDFGQM